MSRRPQASHADDNTRLADVERRRDRRRERLLIVKALGALALVAVAVVLRTVYL